MLFLDMMGLLRYCDSFLQWYTSSSKTFHSYIMWTSLGSFVSAFDALRMITLVTIHGRVREWLASANTVLLRYFLLIGTIDLGCVLALTAFCESFHWAFDAATNEDLARKRKAPQEPQMGDTRNGRSDKSSTSVRTPSSIWRPSNRESATNPTHFERDGRHDTGTS